MPIMVMRDQGRMLDRQSLLKVFNDFVMMEETAIKANLHLTFDNICEEWLQSQPHNLKFSNPMLAHLLHTLLVSHPNQDSAFVEVKQAFLALVNYGCRLINQYWREEYQTIKGFGGYINQQMGCIQHAELTQLMGWLGYTFNRERMSWEVNVTPELRKQLPDVTLDFYLVAAECKLMSLIKGSVVSELPQYLVEVKDVVKYREQIAGAWDSAKQGLRYQIQERDFYMNHLSAMELSNPGHNLNIAGAPFYPNNSYHNPVIIPQHNPTHFQPNPSQIMYPRNDLIPQSHYAPSPMNTYLPSSNYFPPGYNLQPVVPQYSMSQPLHTNQPPTPTQFYHTQNRAPKKQSPSSGDALADVFHREFEGLNLGSQGMPTDVYDKGMNLLEHRYPPVYNDGMYPPNQAYPTNMHQVPPHHVVPPVVENVNKKKYQEGYGTVPSKPNKYEFVEEQINFPGHANNKSRNTATMPHEKPQNVNSSSSSHHEKAQKKGSDRDCWEYVFKNLESQGYSKDLAKRNDILNEKNGKEVNNYNSHKPQADEVDKTLNGRHTGTIRPNVEEVYKSKEPKVKKQSVKTTSEISRVSPQKVPSPIESSGGIATWACSFCTLENKEEHGICQACGKSREVGMETRPLQSGPICPHCTLVNPQGRDYCDVCAAYLRPSLV